MVTTPSGSLCARVHDARSRVTAGGSSGRVVTNHTDPVGTSSAAGSPEPTPRQLEVLAETITHGSRKEAAACLRLSDITVAHHLRNLYARLDASSGMQAALYLGWTTIPGHSGTA